jgi:hypothetical protein
LWRASLAENVMNTSYLLILYASASLIAFNSQFGHERLALGYLHQVSPPLSRPLSTQRSTPHRPNISMTDLDLKIVSNSFYIPSLAEASSARHLLVSAERRLKLLEEDLPSARAPLNPLLAEREECVSCLQNLNIILQFHNCSLSLSCGTQTSSKGLGKANSQSAADSAQILTHARIFIGIMIGTEAKSVCMTIFITFITCRTNNPTGLPRI